MKMNLMEIGDRVKTSEGIGTIIELDRISDLVYVDLDYLQEKGEECTADWFEAYEISLVL